MTGLGLKELYLLLDRRGSLVAYQENEVPWAGVLAFSSADAARRFCSSSGSRAVEIAVLDVDDSVAVAGLVRAVKPRAIRNLLLDLDYATGRCLAVEFEGESLGRVSERHFTPREHR